MNKDTFDAHYTGIESHTTGDQSMLDWSDRGAILKSAQ